jgi:RimJ/RimL family protein N-acetyltransferase
VIVEDGLLYDAHELVSAFVAERIPHMQGQPFGKNVAIGVIRKDRLVGGVVFHTMRVFDGKPVSIEMSGASDDPTWLWPATLRRLFAYPFIQLGCVRMTAVTGRKNKRARRVIEGIGFRLEGVVRKGIDGKEDAMIYGQLREECRFIPQDKNG